MEISSWKHRDSDYNRDIDSTKDSRHSSSKHSDNHLSKHDKHRDTDGDDRRRRSEFERPDDVEWRNDISVKSEPKDEPYYGSDWNDGATESHNFGFPRETPLAPSHPPPKVFLSSTRHENEGVNDAPGKYSTDETSADAGKSGSISPDALSKDKATLLTRNELAEKMNKTPILNKRADLVTGRSERISLKEGHKAPLKGEGSGNPIELGRMKSSSWADRNIALRSIEVPYYHPVRLVSQPKHQHPSLQQPPGFYRPQLQQIFHQTQQTSYHPKKQSCYSFNDDESFDPFHRVYHDTEELSDEEKAIPDIQEDTNEDNEEEAAPIPMGRATSLRRMMVDPSERKGPAPSKQWTTREEVALAKAWIDISEDPVNGNAQRRNQFWKRVLQSFAKRLGGTDRNIHQLNSKWKDMNGKISLFARLFNNWSAKGSGQNETDVLKSTREQYKDLKNNKAFVHEMAWDILRNHPIWCPMPLMDDFFQPPKRTKTSDSNTYTTSSNAQISISHNDEDEEEELLEPERPHRKGKTPVSSSTSRDPLLLCILERLEALSDQNEKDAEDKIRHRMKLEEIKTEKLRLLQERERLIQEKENEERQDKDLQFLLQPHEHLTGVALKAVLARKEKIARRWGWK